MELKDVNLSSNTKLKSVHFTTDEDWLELRTKGIGGSDVGAIMGINKYASPLSIYKQKVDGYRKDLSNNTYVKKGKDLEDFILNNYVKPEFAKEGYEVAKPDFMIINEDYPYFRANVDGIAYNPLALDHLDNIIVEIKWVSEYAEVNWNGDEYCGIPPSYYAQVQLYMLVTGAKEARLCALFDSNWEFKMYVIPRDELFIYRMISAAKPFYEYNMCMHIPPKMNVELDKEDVTKAVAEIPTTQVFVESPEMTSLVDRYVELNKSIKDLEKEKSSLNSEILDYHLKGFKPENGHSVKTSVVHTNRFNSTKFKADNPTLYDQYCEDSESTRFTIK